MKKDWGMYNMCMHQYASVSDTASPHMQAKALFPNNVSLRLVMRSGNSWIVDIALHGY